jgi:hypothetical protein
MSPDDRRRLTLATIITLVALPALWLMQRDDTAPGSPTVAAAGAPAAPAVDSSDEDDDSDDPPAPAYLEGPSTTAPSVDDTPLVIATGESGTANRLTGTAGYRRFDDASSGTCLVTGAPLGIPLTVRNVDNDRTTTCINTSGQRSDEIAVLDISVFLQVADLVDAPLPVEITW